MLKRLLLVCVFGVLAGAMDAVLAQTRAEREKDWAAAQTLLLERAAVLEKEGKAREAIRLYRFAARNGSAPAAARLRDLGETDAAKTNHPSDAAPAQDRPMSRSEREAFRDTEVAAKALEAAARVDHETLYQFGARTEEARIADAIRIYRVAARAGSGKAALRLGEIFGRGIPGVVARDPAQSLQWYVLARELGENVQDDGGRGCPPKC